MKKTTLNDVVHNLVQTMNYILPHGIGKSCPHILPPSEGIYCPFCSQHYPLSSFQETKDGQNCPCGALFSVGGKAYKKVKSVIGCCG